MPVESKYRTGAVRAPDSGSLRGAPTAGSGATDKPVTYRPEIARRHYDLPTAPRARVNGSGPPEKSANHRKLIVGHGISLSGSLSDCEHLIVHGSVEIDLNGCKHIEIVKDGSFKGKATVEEATIGGRFDGELNVTGMLRLRGTGVVVGTVHYGELIVEAGGQLRGTSEPTDEPRKAGKKG